MGQTRYGSIKKINMNDLAAMVMESRTKAAAAGVANYVEKNPRRFQALLQLFIQGDYRLTQQASWPLSLCLERNPALAAKHLSSLLDALESSSNPAVIRNTVRILQFVSIPEKIAGRVMTICFGLVMNPKAAVAPRAFALTVLSNLSVRYPEIIPEIRLCIEQQSIGATAGFLARARRVQKELDRLEKTRRS